MLLGLKNLNNSGKSMYSIENIKNPQQSIKNTAKHQFIVGSHIFKSTIYETKR